MKDLRAIRGAFYMAERIREGEHERQDFKYAINDPRKIARSISAFANREGGMLLVGVKDNGVVAGVRDEEDIYVVEQAAERYCFPPQKLDFTMFRVEGDKVVIRVTVDKAVRRPVECINEHGKRLAYYRVADENIPVPDLVSRAWQWDAGGAIDPHVSQALDFLSAHGGIGSPEPLMQYLHISRKRAEDLICTLYSLSLIDFVYQNGVFLAVVGSRE